MPPAATHDDKVTLTEDGDRDREMFVAVNNLTMHPGGNKKKQGNLHFRSGGFGTVVSFEGCCEGIVNCFPFPARGVKLRRFLPPPRTPKAAEETLAEGPAINHVTGHTTHWDM